MSLGFPLGFLVAAGLTPAVRSAAARWGVVDRPNSRKIHARPTALLGGVAVYGAVAAVALVLIGPHPDLLLVLLGGLLFLGIGLADDLRPLGVSKLLAEFAAAWLIVELTGTVFHLPSQPLSVALTVFWIVGVVNAFNCIDCADGVAASVGLTAGLAFLAIAVLTGQVPEMHLAAAVAGACLGFLPYNITPARIFLGDAGSLALGYLVAMVGVMLSPGTLSIPAMAAPAVVLAIPIYDILYVHIKRFLDGERSLSRLLTSTGKDHLPHRLMDRGLSPRGVTVVVLVASVATGLSGVALAAVNTLPGALAIGLGVIGGLIVIEREWVGAARAGRVPAASGLTGGEGS